MEHIKIYHSTLIRLDDRPLLVEGPVTAERLRQLSMHPGLNAFRKPDEQHEALVEIAELPEGRMMISCDGDVIVGYVTFHYPDDMERWSQGRMPDLLELGAVEVAAPYRSLGLSKLMIRLAFDEEQMEKMIVFTTEYYWHWDLEGTRLNVWDYRKMMEKLMRSVNMVWFATDDPEICSHPANCLMVRIGKHVPLASVEQFDRIRFQQRFMY